MITVSTNEHDEIVITGEMAEDDVVQNYCCAGFAWEVAYIHKLDAAWTSIWGICANPECPNYQVDVGPTDMYRGVSNVSVESLAEWLLDNQI